MYVYINAIKFKDDIEYLQGIAKQLSDSVHIPYEECLKALTVDEFTLKEYAVEIAYYCSVDSIRC